MDTPEIEIEIEVVCWNVRRFTDDDEFVFDARNVHRR
jgi:hypothetical protein